MPLFTPRRKFVPSPNQSPVSRRPSSATDQPAFKQELLHTMKKDVTRLETEKLEKERESILAGRSLSSVAKPQQPTKTPAVQPTPSWPPITPKAPTQTLTPRPPVADFSRPLAEKITAAPRPAPSPIPLSRIEEKPDAATMPPQPLEIKPIPQKPIALPGLTPEKGERLGQPLSGSAFDKSRLTPFMPSAPKTVPAPGTKEIVSNIVLPPKKSKPFYKNVRLILIIILALGGIGLGYSFFAIRGKQETPPATKTPTTPIAIPVATTAPLPQAPIAPQKPSPTPPVSAKIQLKKKIIFTFDDGPDPATTSKIIEALKPYDVEAYFFPVGEKAEKNPDLARLIIQSGYSLGYGSMRHQNLTLLSQEDITRDIDSFKRLIKNKVDPSYEIRIGRPPFGGFTPNSVRVFWQLENDGELASIDINALSILVPAKIRRAFEGRGLQIILWNADFKDWERPISVDEVLLQTKNPGMQVLLFHETPFGGSVKISDIINKLPTILEKLKK